MRILKSIQSLDKANIIETQNRPIIIHASDLKFYYCKYHNPVGTAHRLFKESLIACFLKCWGFNSAPAALIEVLPEHVPTDLTIPNNRFNVPCFGVQKVEDVLDLNKVTEDLLITSKNIQEVKAHLLKIAFFDIWTANEDRHNQNYNLLYKLVGRKYVLYPIDHEACFNSQNLERGLVQINYEESLMYSTLFFKLFKISDFGDQLRMLNLKQSFYLCSQKCASNINDYLKNIPAGWNIDMAAKEKELKQFLLNDEWFENCWDTFLTFVQNFSAV